MNYVRILFLAIGIVIIACEKDKEPNILPPIDEVSARQQDAIDYFEDIALGFEFGSASRVTRKWVTDIDIFVRGDLPEFLNNELNEIVAELNSLISDSGITIGRVETQSDANFLIYFGPGHEYADINPNAAEYVDGNWGLFFVNFNSMNEIGRADMYVDTGRPSELKQRHLLREELTQALGLARDSRKYADSIFQSNFNLGCATEYSEFDEVLIQMLYDSELPTGLSEGSALASILNSIIHKYLPE